MDTGEASLPLNANTPPPPGSDLSLAVQFQDDPAFRQQTPPVPDWHRLHDNPHPHPPPPAGQEPSESQDGSENESGSESYDSDEEAPPQRPWQPIAEDTTVPCADELEFLANKGEKSALDHEHWEKEAFFEISDPELVPGASGRIDWLVEGFNGTEENPNREVIMRSPVVCIGGLDWQIKFYPNGNGSQYLSVYVECTSMLQPDFAETEDFRNPPFPFLKGAKPIRKRRSVAAQLLVVMYNPAEPRVYEVQSEAHQFHKKQADYGWVYFSKQTRSEFHIRQHLQRQAILRNDQLAFKAYVRIVDDPTGDMWEHGEPSPEHITSVTGLRPFKKSLQYIAGVVPLLHFAPFRKFVQELPGDTQLARWLQPLLLKMFTRQRSATFNTRGTIHEGDVMEMIFSLGILFNSEYDSSLSRQWQQLIGGFHSERELACGVNRLNTKDYPSIQDAIENHPRSVMKTQLLILELTRQEHDKKARKWRKLTNNVRVEDHIQVEGVNYTLFAFVTHCGHLLSSRYNSYVRPNGVGNGWYEYGYGLVTRLTEKQAKDRHSGIDADHSGASSPGETTRDGHDSPFSQYREPRSEVPSIVMYCRDDVAVETFNAPKVEGWVPPHLRASLSLTSLPKPGIAKDKTLLPNHQIIANDEQFKHRGGVDGQQLVLPQESEEARLADLIQRAADVATPELGSQDGADIIMRDADDESMDSAEAAEAAEADLSDEASLEKATFSWLGRCHYEGQWKGGKYHGGGHLIDINGDEYLGNFANGLKHGYGKMIYASSGDIYDGNWVEGKHHGIGKLTEFSSGNVFEGGWLDGKKHGPFVLKGTVTEEDKSCCTICYENEMTTAFVDCGHVVACRECAARIEICPVCRRRIQAKLQLFGVKLSSS